MREDGEDLDVGGEVAVLPLARGDDPQDGEEGPRLDREPDPIGVSEQRDVQLQPLRAALLVALIRAPVPDPEPAHLALGASADGNDPGGRPRKKHVRFPQEHRFVRSETRRRHRPHQRFVMLEPVRPPGRPVRSAGSCTVSPGPTCRHPCALRSSGRLLFASTCPRVPAARRRASLP